MRPVPGSGEQEDPHHECVDQSNRTRDEGNGVDGGMRPKRQRGFRLFSLSG